ncbi:trehalose-6-phosphate hydrolase [Clostridium cavendishii DSM 21758]|uniref:Alpha,alpha-phosphotrehalase n=1 Tax=Clostridium cavendishii DSM 21758 TaxID=1121302 RepID=A0A1M6LL83_9CLOT|nr:alpha,alpha-phosphotrehalase [Clostridium cavendishii]SHJ71913.1 trehalose-6-phosphate hydrolase [Clostridium cavendishii DSM 21758]
MENNNWWKSSVVYQIYPKSFKDSNGDGIGDIGGIIEKLDYLKDLGVEVLWLTPIYVSPQRDNGYDIADYYNIDPRFGDMEKFEELLDSVHKKGMKLIMDMVVNHTSTDHKWFKEALKGKENPYHDFYIWKQGKDNKAPNNWTSKFSGSAWEYVESLDSYYLHLFDKTQADLNWENPKLREEIFKMMRFWMDKGVDGFRLDVVNLLSKDSNFSDDDYITPNRDGRRFYTDGPKIHEYLQEMNEQVFSRYPSSMTVGEMSSTTIENCIRYTNPENKELSMTFNFHHLKVDYPNGEKWSLAPVDFKLLKETLFDWQVEMEQGNGWNAMFWCNHDQPRSLSRFGNDTKYREESAKMLATMIHLMRGTPYIYQGEEIGMTNPNFENIEKYRDVESLNIFNELKSKGMEEKNILDILMSKSRDNSRTPVQWNSSKNAGFTDGEPWIEVSKNYKEINAEVEMIKENSIYKHYKDLISLRKKYDVISMGTIKTIMLEQDKIVAYIREFKNEKMLVVCNFYGEQVDIFLDMDINKQQFIISNYDFCRLQKEMTLRPYEAFAVMI